MAKTNFKQVLIEKGERYAFFAAGGLMLLLMVGGLLELSSSSDTDTFVKEIEQNNSRIKSAMSDPNAKPPELPDYARRIVTFSSVRMSDLKALNFDPINPPDMRRTNPSVKQVMDLQAKFMWAKIPSLDIRDIDGKPHIGVVVVKAGAKAESVDKEKQSEFMNQVSRRIGKQLKKRPNPNPMGGNFGAEGFMGGGPGPGGMLGVMGGPVGPGPGGMLGVMGGPVGPGPGGMLGVMGGPVGPGPGGRQFGIMGGPVGPGPGGMLGAMGGPGVGALGGAGKLGRPPGPGGFEGAGGEMPGPMGFMGGEGFGAQIEVGERLGIEYVPLDPEKLEGKRLALTIYPQRMMIIHGAFPYKEQVQEIARALRIKEPAEIFDPKNDAAPIFKGFLIQRKILYPDYRIAADWHTLNYESHYKDTIYPRTLGDQEDPPELSYVKLPPEAEMVMPLPDLSAMKGRYPEIGLESIRNTIQKASALSKPPALPKSKSRLKGEGGVFGSNKLETGAWGAQPNSPEFTVPGRPGAKKMGMGFEGESNTENTTVHVAELPEAVLIRLIDNEIIPGRLYQYRMKVLMQNPNWAGPQEKGEWARKDKFDLVSQRQDAKRMLLGASEEDARIIEQRFFSDIKDEKARAEEVRWNLDKKEAATPWFEMKGVVGVPQEEFFFAIDPPQPTHDPKEPKKTVGGVTLKPGEGLIQIQRWLPTANIKGYREPVADWVVADVLAKRGYYFGGEQFVNLPIWSSEYNRYILRKVPPEKDSKQKETRRGVVMDPTKPGPRYAVIDVEGGTISKRYGSRTIDDESAAEILLVDEDGGLHVRSSARDRNSLLRYMPDPLGPYVIHSGNQVTRYQPNAKYNPEAFRVVDREEVWNKWVEETDMASRKVDPESTGPVVPKKFD